MRYEDILQNSDCKKCEDRVVGCHAKCEKYIAWRTALDEAAEEKRKYIKANQGFYERMIDKRDKRMREKKGGKK